MKKTILARYERDASGAVVIDVGADGVADLYENFDKTASFLKKDLDPHLAAYLTDCAREIGDEAFVIRIALAAPPTPGLEDRIRTSLANFFGYLEETERRDMSGMARTSLVLLGAGLGFLTLAVWLGEWMGNTGGVFAHVFPEGITVAGWVSLWHAAATYLIDWRPHRRTVRLYRRLAEARVLFTRQT